MNRLSLFIILLIGVSSSIRAEIFYHEKARGWYWYEVLPLPELPKKEKEKEKDKEKEKQVTPQKEVSNEK